MTLAENSFDASWPEHLDLSFTTEPSFVCCLPCCAVLFSTRNEGKTEGVERTIPHLPTGDNCRLRYFQDKFPFFILLRGEAAYFFTLKEELCSKHRTLKQRDIHSHRTWSLKDSLRSRRKAPWGSLDLTGHLFGPFLFWFGFSFVWVFFFMTTGWKSLVTSP